MTEIELQAAWMLVPQESGGPLVHAPGYTEIGRGTLSRMQFVAKLAQRARQLASSAYLGAVMFRKATRAKNGPTE